MSSRGTTLFSCLTRRPSQTTWPLSGPSRCFSEVRAALNVHCMSPAAVHIRRDMGPAHRDLAVPAPLYARDRPSEQRSAAEHYTFSLALPHSVRTGDSLASPCARAPMSCLEVPVSGSSRTSTSASATSDERPALSAKRSAPICTAPNQPLCLQSSAYLRPKAPAAFPGSRASTPCRAVCR